MVVPPATTPRSSSNVSCCRCDAELSRHDCNASYDRHACAHPHRRDDTAHRTLFVSACWPTVQSGGRHRRLSCAFFCWRTCMDATVRGALEACGSAWPICAGVRHSATLAVSFLRRRKGLHVCASPPSTSRTRLPSCCGLSSPPRRRPHGRHPSRPQVRDPPPPRLHLPMHAGPGLAHLPNDRLMRVCSARPQALRALR